MPTRLYLRLAELLAAALLAAIVFSAWRAERRDSTQLAADLATAKQSLAQADARQHDRDTQLLQTLAALAVEKRAITTPAQIVRDLPKQIPLPSPITVQPASPSCGPAGFVECGGLAAAFGAETKPRLSTTATEPSTEAKSTAPAQAILPAADLKPLYDFAIDCKACEAKLATSQADLANERAKAAVLAHERDEAIHVAKGGTLLHRIARNAKWLAIGALAGAAAARAHR